MKGNLKSLLLLIHYWFPVALGWSIATVIHHATDLPILPSGIHLYLLCILAAYSFDRLYDNNDSSRPAWIKITLLSGFLAASVLGFFFALQVSIQTLSAMVIFSIITVFYSWMKKFPFVKFLLVSIVWAWAGVALPFANQHWFAWQFWTMQTSMPLVILIACGCILCDFKDITSDLTDGVRSLPVTFGPRNTILITSALLGITAFISYFDGRPGLLVSSLILIGLAQFPKVLSLDAIGPLVVDMVLTIPGFMIALHVI